MTSGGKSVTGGGSGGGSGGGEKSRLASVTEAGWGPVAVVAAVAVVVAVVNATSKLMEASSDGVSVDPRAPWAVEITSILLIVALAPAIGWAVARIGAPRAQSVAEWARAGALHVLAATVFSLAHVAGMTLLRKAVYGLVGEDYVFAGPDGVWLPLVYEWRKDVLAYAAIAVLYWGWRRWSVAAPAPAATPAQGTDTRIEVRDGSRVVMIEPAQIAWLEAAGNYVEIHLGGGMHLARGTLAAFETRLAGLGFVRIHRSRLVNRARVSALKPTAAGDVEVTLDDGRVITGSRRYRDGL